ncbi:NACHT and WD repeat domain-containing protein [Amycolatopsis azurea]|uniref:WD-40 repeat protein n=1 Tax=Amycolatopsis azurea DSM 43854 TaxID=1238180 RepID=M2QRD3_9PSEU|nr:AAA family ATPase [Amycolatopsis azurea]EMD29221.1 hypothetical protein C791_4961 [Amycolatopsis azurea DSM 43854]OOC01932.1 hypothetical protein B0293_37220 [Amycolatopsis azurea DSM 43854]
MPRQERPLDQEDEVLSQFAAGLRRLRAHAGNPTYRELGRRAHYAASTLAEAAGGQKLPTLPVTLGYVRACGGDVAEWEQRWHEIATALADRENEVARQSDGEPPYVGLAAFQPDDTAWFFGRERLVSELVERVRNERFVAVFGPSGIGKSSLLRAGLIPALGNGAVVFTPGPHPLGELAARLAGTDPGDGRDEAVMVVDQFEEVFTLCTDQDERARFIDALVAATSDGGRRVVIGMRADFYSRCADHPRLAAAVCSTQVLVGPMAADELRDVIVKPAAAVHCSVEGVLVTQLVTETDGRPGVLPLLSHALRETWRRRSGNRLSLAGYQATGGIAGALSRTAEREYAAMTPEARLLTKRLFLRSIALGEGTEHTKRRVRLDEFDLTESGAHDVLTRLTDARLITRDTGTVEIAHESLIKFWPRLREWIEADREGLHVHRQVTEATQSWQALHRDPGALARGTRLAIARAWAAEDPGALSPVERKFLDASNEAETRERRTTRRRVRQLRWLAAGLTVLLVSATALAGVAMRNERDAAELSRIARSRQFAAQADAMAGRDTGTATRLALQALKAHATTEARSSLLTLAGRPTSHGLIPAPALALSSDGQRLATPGPEQTLAIWDVPRRQQTTLIQAVFPKITARPGVSILGAFSQDGTRLVTVTDAGFLILWNPGPGGTIAVVPTPRRIRAVAFSPDGTRIATVDQNQTLELRDAASLRVLVTATGSGEGSDFASATYSPDGHTLVTTAGRERIVLRDPADGTVQATLPASPYDTKPLAFDRESGALAVPDPSGGIALWDLRTRTVKLTARNVGPVNGLAFDRTSGNLLVTGNDAVTVWNRELTWPVKLAETGATTPATGGGTLAVTTTAGTLLWESDSLPILTFSQVDDLAFDAAGTGVLATGTTLTRRWPVAGPHTDGRPMANGHPGALRQRLGKGGGLSAALLPSGDIVFDDLVSGSTRRTLANPGGHPKAALALTPDATTVAAVYTPPKPLTSQIGLTVWDIATGRVLADLPTWNSSVAFSPREHLLAAGEGDYVEIWDFATGTRRTEFSTVTTDQSLHKQQVSTLTYSPDGALLAVALIDGTIGLWDALSGTKVTDLPGLTVAPTTLAFSPAGRFLVAGGNDGAIVIWELATKETWANLNNRNPITAIAWNDTETTLATAGQNGVLRLWPVDTTAAARQLCASLTQRFPAAAPDGETACAGS